MAFLDNQQTWAPYQDTKDCSLGFCSLYCPQWCYMVFPPPPPMEFPREGSGANFSPLVIAIIGMLASSFLLISYYVLASKYCSNPDSRRRRRSQHDPHEEFDDSRNPSRNEPLPVATSGLDEALIKSITVCKYKRGDGVVEGTDCSVCLSEFQEDESLRLLPKCSHAFHLPCIDKWLKSHSSCPLCRAGVVPITSLSPQSPLPALESIPNHSSSRENRQESDTIVDVDDLERGEEEPSLGNDAVVSKFPLRAPHDLNGPHERDTIIEIRDEEIRPIRRSFSMDSCHDCISIADELMMNMGDIDDGHCHFPMDVGSSKHCGEHRKNNNRSRVLHSVKKPTAMKRSSSCGRLLTRQGRGRNVDFLI
eukprot:TRINITY_DN45391_c0_g1_i1.p1 TRINITY_DN45391_c0_g1~~TRINITY_DN45391_c0_g1_i1.p1  ORF type:complete len:364 (+),score=68.75 TRINITY_DN45391_c0_g1_i1:337-1428(+)